MKQNNIVPLDFEKPLFALSKQIIELESKTIHNGNKKTVENLKIQYENVNFSNENAISQY